MLDRALLRRDGLALLPENRQRPWLTIRAVIAVGFALILASWLFAWTYFSAQFVHLEEQAQVINARYLLAQEQVSATRADVYRASILIRDLLLSPEPPGDAARAEPIEAYDQADARLAGYEPVQVGDTRGRIELLRAEIAALRRAATTLVSVDGQPWWTAAANWRLSDIRPRRDAAIRIANELQALNRDDFLQHQRRTIALYGDLQRRLTASLGLSLIASLGIAALAGVRVTRLERHLFRQHERDRQNQHDLQRLSAALIEAQEKERRHIARELHDEVGQVLTAIKVELSIAERTLAPSGGRVGALDEARTITDRALQTVRDLSRLLHPAMLDDIGLSAALDGYIRGYSKRHDIRVDYTTSGCDDRLAADIESNLYRIVQEALTNVARHAAVSECTVRIEHAAGVVRVTVADKGRGFDPVIAQRDRSDTGLGLVGIRERVRLLGGAVALNSGPGQGTRLDLTIPARTRELATEGSTTSFGEKATAHGWPATT